MAKRSPGFTVSKSDAPDGDFPLLYIRFRTGAVERTKEVISGRAYSDHDAEGHLLGIEVIAPVARDKVLNLTPAELRNELREFLSAPPYSKTVLTSPSAKLAALPKKRKAPKRAAKKKRQNPSGISLFATKSKKPKAKRRSSSLEPA
jgi:hypothetical protein